MKKIIELKEMFSDVYALLEEKMRRKIEKLLATDDEAQIRSNIELLYSLDERYLVELLCENDEQLVLRQDIGLHHLNVWRTALVKIFWNPDSAWHQIYLLDGFQKMELLAVENISWQSLPDFVQKKRRKHDTRMVDIPAGQFILGINITQAVTLTKNFRVCAYPCTQGLYSFVMGENPAEVKGASRAICGVSWCESILFCNRLSEIEGREPVYEFPQPFQNTIEWAREVKWNRMRNGYRLLTEAEWVYAALAGEEFRFAGSDNIEDVAYSEYARGFNAGLIGRKPIPRKPYAIGQLQPNTWGLYDMSGNVTEWCYDAYTTYPSREVDPVYDYGDKDIYISRGKTHTRIYRHRCRTIQSRGTTSPFRGKKDFKIGFRFGYDLSTDKDT